MTRPLKIALILLVANEVRGLVVVLIILHIMGRL